MSTVDKRLAKAAAHVARAKEAAATIARSLEAPEEVSAEEVFAAAKILEAAGCYVRRHCC